jgi:hypothetical protein
LFSFKSNTWTFPSAVTAANTVLEYGDQATSPTAFPRSNDMIGTLSVRADKYAAAMRECERDRRSGK